MCKPCLTVFAALACLAPLPVLAQTATRPAAPAAPVDQQQIANTKLWNANPSPKDPHDLQGVWLLDRGIRGASPVTGANVDAAGAQQFVPKAPLQIAAGERRTAMAKAGTPLMDSSSVCLPHGVPRIMNSGYPIQFDYGPGIIVMLHEVIHDVRIIHMDGQPAPADEPITYMGYSRGHWDGPSLIVDTDHLNDKTWIDEDWLYHGARMKVHEEFTKFTNRYGGVELLDLITIDDPDYYTRPWTFSKILAWRGDMGISEYTCEENNRNKAVNGVTVAK